MVLDEIGAFLAAGGIGTVGTTIFLGSSPDTPDACVTVYEYGGLPPEHTLGTDNVIERPRVQVVARGALNDYAAARSKAKDIFNVMKGGLQTLSGIRYLRIEPVDSPFVLRLDETTRWLVACNYQIYKDAS